MLQQFLDREQCKKKVTSKIERPLLQLKDREREEEEKATAELVEGETKCFIKEGGLYQAYIQAKRNKTDFFKYNISWFPCNHFEQMNRLCF